MRQSVPRPAVHILINIRVSRARTARASPIVPPRLWVSIKINIRTRVSSHRKYAVHPSLVIEGIVPILAFTYQYRIDRSAISSLIDSR